jgi:hypothetical protein
MDACTSSMARKNEKGKNKIAELHIGILNFGFLMV